MQPFHDKISRMIGQKWPPGFFNPAGCFCCNPPPEICSPCTYSSSEMSAGEIDVTQMKTGWGGYSMSVVCENSSENGNPPPAWRIEIDAADEQPAGDNAKYIFNIFNSMEISPKSQGKIKTLTFCLHSILTTNSTTTGGDLTKMVEIYPAVYQNGKFFIAARIVVPSSSWKRNISASLTASSFSRVVDETGVTNEHPNFDISGPPVRLGFAVVFRSYEGATDTLLETFIDNFCVYTPDLVCCAYGGSRFLLSFSGTASASVKAALAATLPAAELAIINAEIASWQDVFTGGATFVLQLTGVCQSQYAGSEYSFTLNQNNGSKQLFSLFSGSVLGTNAAKYMGTCWLASWSTRTGKCSSDFTADLVSPPTSSFYVDVNSFDVTAHLSGF